MSLVIIMEHTQANILNDNTENYDLNIKKILKIKAILSA